MSVPYFSDPEGPAPLQDNDELLDDVLDDDPVIESETEAEFWSRSLGGLHPDDLDESGAPISDYPWWGPDE